MNRSIKNILPSKKFSKITAITVVVLGALFLIFFVFSNKSSIFSKNKSKISKQTVLELVQSDQDGDTIPDWEEALWGTDKLNRATYGVSDVSYIEDKKKALNLEQDRTLENDSATETDKFAREFFSAYVALKDSGDVNDTTINGFSHALGQRVISQTLTDLYQESDVKINKDDTREARGKYYDSLQSLYEKYSDSGIGDELAIVSGGLISKGKTGSEGNYDELLLVAEAYQEFARESMELSVPEGLIRVHLQIVNGANNTGVSVHNMAKISADPIIGVSGISQYQTYSEELINSVDNLREAL